MTGFHRIAASAPVNASAARQMGRGVEWQPAVALQDYFADLPPMKPAAYYRAKSMGNGEWIDFRGKSFGRLTVAGVMAKDSEAKASWVCRCQCGGFCTRKAKSLKVADRGGNTFVPTCGRCEYQRKLRMGWTPDLWRSKAKQERATA